MTRPPTFQEVIMILEKFWAGRGCLMWQPYNVQVGAGTMNPATTLRVLGPEPWNVGYAEPSIRPDDSRYGENPNRMQQHYQYQVILKPDPGTPQEIYLESLEALGLDPRQHDIRFVEDNWESPALGAWGLGWEVWLDGQEITQFTYFQQAGGLNLDPVAVEITYGLERIMMPLQGVRSFTEIEWASGLTYGDVLLQAEIEHSRYNLDHADVKLLAELFTLYEQESYHCLEEGLVIPAYDYILKCSHTFNILDARGAIGVAERARYFARMRDMTHQVAVAYVQQREEMGFPFLEQRAASSKQQAVRGEPRAAGGEPQAGAEEKAVDFLLEIGCEELPVGDLDSALEQLADSAPELLNRARLEYESCRVTGTPRRLVVYLTGLTARQTDLEHMVKGPPAKVAYDDKGQPTSASAGFARSQGVAVEDLRVQDFEGRGYVVAVKKEQGRPTIEVLAHILPELIASLRFPLSMRWNESGVAFSRPIRWLVALLGQTVIDFECAAVRSDHKTRGLRPLRSPEIVIERADDYFQVMAENHIVVDLEERRASIREQASQLAAEIGGQIPDDPTLLEEVTNLVECPTALRGAFEERFLELPHEVLITVMKKHQRYFPIVDADGKLMPYFITVRNGDDQHLDVVRTGNEEVLRARFSDADFFYRADTQKKLEDFLPRLDTLTFQENLGSMLDKTNRLTKLVTDLADLLGLSEAEKQAARRAAELAKADLATQMVTEFTSLQGIMGGYYARLSGEGEEVARDISELYTIPTSGSGMALGLGDRLDSLVGLFSVGLKPSGSADPYGLRRAALEVMHILIGQKRSLDLRVGLEKAARLLPKQPGRDTLDEALGFLEQRLRGWLREQDYRYDVVDAVLAERGHDPYLAYQTVGQFAPWVERPDWMGLLNAYARCVRIVRDYEGLLPLDPAGFVEPATKRLHQAYQTCQAQVGPDSTADELFAAFQPMIEPINTFFDEVLVMAEDKELRENRLALLQRIAALTRGIVDLSRMEGF